MKCDRRALKYNSQEKCDVCHPGNVSSPLLSLFNMFVGIVNVFSENPVAGSQNDNPPPPLCLVCVGFQIPRIWKL